MYPPYGIAALTCGAGGEPQVRRLCRQVKWLVPAQGDGTRPNKVSAAIPGDVVDWNAQAQPTLVNHLYFLSSAKQLKNVS